MYKDVAIMSTERTPYSVFLRTVQRFSVFNHLGKHISDRNATHCIWVDNIALQYLSVCSSL